MLTIDKMVEKLKRKVCLIVYKDYICLNMFNIYELNMENQVV